MKITQMSNNAIVVTDDKGIHTLFSYESEVLRYNPRNKDMTVYTNIANYSNTTKKHVRMFCEQYINSDEVVEASRAIFDPKKSYKDLKILHIFNDLVQMTKLGGTGYESIKGSATLPPPFVQQWTGNSAKN